MVVIPASSWASYWEMARCIALFCQSEQMSIICTDYLCSMSAPTINQLANESLDIFVVVIHSFSNSTTSSFDMMGFVMQKLCVKHIR